MTDNDLDQIVKGTPPPNVSPTQVAETARRSSRPPAPSITAPHLPATHRHPSTATDPRDALPSSPPQIYLNLLILESSLRLQYLSLRARLRLHLLLLFALTCWLTTFTYLLFFRPREDGSGVGGSIYWMIESGEKLGWCGGVVTTGLFWGTGMYERGVRWPRKFVSTTNRGLRAFNLKIVIVKGKGRSAFQVVPKDIEAASTYSTSSTPQKDYWNHHATRHGLVEEDTAPAGDVLKLLLLPKPFSPDFRSGWEEFRTEYWERENSRRANLRRVIAAREREVARREGWYHFRRMMRYSSKTRRQKDLERLALKEKPSAGELQAMRRRRVEDRAESVSRGSSRSSTPAPSAVGSHGRRGSSTHSSTGSRRKKATVGQGSRLSATETVLQDEDGSGSMHDRPAPLTRREGSNETMLKREESLTPEPFLEGAEIKQEPDEA